MFLLSTEKLLGVSYLRTLQSTQMVSNTSGNLVNERSRGDIRALRGPTLGARIVGTESKNPWWCFVVKGNTISHVEGKKCLELTRDN